MIIALYIIIAIVVLLVGLRLISGRHIVTTIDIDATPERVWDILIDFKQYGDWNPFITSLSGTPDVGEKLSATIHPPGKDAMGFKPRVLKADRAKELRWLGNAGVPGVFDGEHYWELSENESGGTHLIHGENFSGVLVPFLWGSVESGTRKGFEIMNETLKSRVEQTTETQD